MLVKIRYLFILILIFCFSCSPKVKEQPTADNIVIFPSPPDTARIQFLTRFSVSTDFTGQRSGFMKYILGEEEVFPIIKPYGISIYKGKIYICDTILGGLEIIDLKDKSFRYFKPKGMGQIRKPINCFVDDSGAIYVADAERKQIVVFDKNLNYIGSFCDGSTMKPTDVYVDENGIWVCDLKGRKIRVYEKGTFNLLRSFPDNDTVKNSVLRSPTNLYVTENRVYVSDFGDFNVKVYSHDGEYIRSVGGYGKGLGQFVRPKGVAVNRDDNLFVVDAGIENVQIFDNQGQLLMFFGGSYKAPGNMWLPAKIIIDYDNLEYFQEYVYKNFILKHLIFVTNQYGPDKISVYGFIETKN